MILEGCVYFKKATYGGSIYLLIYVDDMLIVCKNMVDIIQLKKALNFEFEMKDLGAAKKIVGIDSFKEKEERHTLTESKRVCTKGTKGIWYVGCKSCFYTYTFTLQAQSCQMFYF